MDYNYLKPNIFDKAEKQGIHVTIVGSESIFPYYLSFVPFSPPMSIKKRYPQSLYLFKVVVSIVNTILNRHILTCVYYNYM